MGIAAGFAATAACGIVRVGTAADVEFKFDVADCVMFLFGAVETEEFKFAGHVIAVLEFAEFGAGELRTIDRLEIKLESLVPSVFALNSSAERTSLAAFVAGVTEVAGAAGLNSTRFWPTEVVLNCEYMYSASSL